MAPKLSGFVCANHPAVLDSNPEHTIYAFISQILYNICIDLALHFERFLENLMTSDVGGIVLNV